MAIQRDIAEFTRALAGLNLAEIQRAALAEQGRHLAEAVRDNLAHPPGGDHRFPWRHSGALAESIGDSADETTALVGSTSEIAPFLEHGTAAMPPRPFLAPAAMAGAGEAAHSVAAAIVTAIRSL